VADIAEHERVNDILLGALERSALNWLAARLPAWVTPDRCSAIGVVGGLWILVSYALSGLHPNFLWLASLGFVINWFGDSLDGTLARYRHIERPIYGFFLDHTVDAATTVVIFLGLGLTPYVNYVVASLALMAYLLLSVLVYVRTAVVGEFKISYGRLGPTEIRALAILLNVYMYFGGIRNMVVPLGVGRSLAFSPYDIIVGAIALLLAYFYLTTAIREILQLRRAGK
jgi:archaetidylinositol phosphate synthase